MKNFTLIFLLIVLIVAGCKKETANKKNSEENLCDSVICQNGGVCDSGVCICPIGYSGLNCEATPTDSVEGDYLVTTDLHWWAMGYYDSTKTIYNDTLHFFRNSDTTIQTNAVSSYNYLYLFYKPDSSTQGRKYFDINGSNSHMQYNISVFPANNDSVYFFFHSGGNGSGYDKMCSGHKIQ